MALTSALIVTDEEWAISTLTPTCIVRTRNDVGPDEVQNIAHVAHYGAMIGSSEWNRACERARLMAVAPTLLGIIKDAREIVLALGGFAEDLNGEEDEVHRDLVRRIDEVLTAAGGKGRGEHP